MRFDAENPCGMNSTCSVKLFHDFFRFLITILSFQLHNDLVRQSMPVNHDDERILMRNFNDVVHVSLKFERVSTKWNETFRKTSCDFDDLRGSVVQRRLGSSQNPDAIALVLKWLGRDRSINVWAHPDYCSRPAGTKLLGTTDPTIALVSFVVMLTGHNSTIIPRSAIKS